MPRTTGGVYTRPTGTTAVSGQTISSADYNSVIDDLTAEQNAIRPVTAGGTGAATLTSGRILTGNGTSPISSTLVAPSGGIVGTTDTQTLSNKSLTAPTITGAFTIDDDTITLPKLVDISSMRALGNVSGSAGAVAEIPILDEDDFSSNSATSLATQQSIKALFDGLQAISDSDTVGTRGHVTFLGGIKINWGQRDGTGSVTFNSAFATSFLAATVTPVTSSDADNIRECSYHTPSTTGMSVVTGAGSGVTLNYIAIGI